MKHGYTCPIVRELWNQMINSGMSILVLGFFHSLTDSLQKHNNIKQKIILHKCKTQITLWKVLQNIFPKQMFGPKGVNYDLYWSRPVKYLRPRKLSSIFGIFREAVFFWCKNMECDQNQLWSKIGMNGRCAFTKLFLTTVTN